VDSDRPWFANLTSSLRRPNVEPTSLLSYLAEQLRRGFAELSSDQRDVIELAYFEGAVTERDFRETGEAPGTVKTYVRTALRSLRKCFDDQAQSEPGAMPLPGQRQGIPEGSPGLRRVGAETFR
jgi:DNA-directed RNA polymerase specialized sigma24 family protein